MKWYILQTAPNYENKVIREVEAQKNKAGVAHFFGEVFSPEEKVMAFDKKSQKKEVTKKLYPNYIFLELDFNDEVWHFLKKIKGVLTFIGGSKNKPNSIPEAQVLEIKKKVSTETARPKVKFDVGQKVFIQGGTFKDFFGIVESINFEKNKAKVKVMVFNRETAVEMDIPDLAPSV